MNDNPLGAMVGQSSQQFQLNKLDFMKAGRLILVQLIGLFVTLGVPYLTGLKYNWNGRDWTAEVLIVVNALAELARRFLTAAPKT